MSASTSKEAWRRALGNDRVRYKVLGDARNAVAKELEIVTRNPYRVVECYEARQQGAEPVPAHAPTPNASTKADDPPGLKAAIARLRRAVEARETDRWGDALSTLVYLRALDEIYSGNNAWRALFLDLLSHLMADDYAFLDSISRWADEVVGHFEAEVRGDARLATYAAWIDGQRPTLASVQIEAWTAAAEALASVAGTFRLLTRLVLIALAIAVAAAGLDETNLVDSSGIVTEFLKRIGD